MLLALLIPFVLQGAAMFVDELVFHRRRGLPRWERIGHPLDTATVVLCFAWLLLAKPSSSNAMIFVGLAAFSCLFITKDEPVHKVRCSATEQWLHSVLFVLHPIVLGAAGWAWWTQQHLTVLTVQLGLVLAFGLHQLIYWNGPWQPQRS